MIFRWKCPQPVYVLQRTLYLPQQAIVVNRKGIQRVDAEVLQEKGGGTFEGLRKGFLPSPVLLPVRGREWERFGRLTDKCS
jgi:hypothetical protein